MFVSHVRPLSVQCAQIMCVLNACLASTSMLDLAQFSCLPTARLLRLLLPPSAVYAWMAFTWVPIRCVMAARLAACSALISGRALLVMSAGN